LGYVQYSEINCFWQTTSSTDFRLSWKLIIHVNYVLEMLLFVDVGSIVNVLEVYADSIFRIDPEGGGSM
jgi:hypothetical protein